MVEQFASHVDLFPTIVEAVGGDCCGHLTLARARGLKLVTQGEFLMVADLAAARRQGSALRSAPLISSRSTSADTRSPICSRSTTLRTRPDSGSSVSATWNGMV